MAWIALVLALILALDGLLLRSGSGKTTALRLAAGFLAPGSGRVTNSFRRTAFVFQNPRLLPWAGAVENGAFGLKAKGAPRQEREAKAAKLLQRFGFERREFEKLPNQLSGGMAQRVSIAPALTVEPDFLLMDEPFSALDAALRKEMQELLRAEVKRAGTAALFVNHDAVETVRLADAIMSLSSGRCHAIAAQHAPVLDEAESYDAAAALLRRIQGGLLSLN